MKFSVFQLSRKGGRHNNEDRMGYCYTRESALFLLADGMGGHPEGEVAAQIALQAISAMFQKEAKPTIGDASEFLPRALMSAHHQIIRYASEKGMLDTPRTTLVAAVMQGSSVTWIHCGDSRMYWGRSGEMLTRTRDHSYAEQAQHDNVRALEMVNRNVLFTCLGSPTRPVFDLGGPSQLQQGDRVLLCSDGLWGSVDDAEITRILCKRGVGDCVPEMVDLALKNGGDTSDNVTVIAMEWETPDAFEATRGISTGSISDGVFASTIQASVLGTAVDDLDDAAIERSIAEINEAIRRTAAKKG